MHARAVRGEQARGSRILQRSLLISEILLHTSTSKQHSSGLPDLAYAVTAFFPPIEFSFPRKTVAKLVKRVVKGERQQMCARAVQKWAIIIQGGGIYVFFFFSFLLVTCGRVCLSYSTMAARPAGPRTSPLPSPPTVRLSTGPMHCARARSALPTSG